jgi:hypothetical protein
MSKTCLPDMLNFAKRHPAEFARIGELFSADYPEESAMIFSPKDDSRAIALAAELLPTLPADNPLASANRMVGELASAPGGDFCKSFFVARIAVLLRGLDVPESSRELLVNWFARYVPWCAHDACSNGGYCQQPARAALTAFTKVVNKVLKQKNQKRRTHRAWK